MELDPEASAAGCRQRVAHFTVPAYVVAVEDPMTVTGTMQKIREQAVADLGLPPG